MLSLSQISLPGVGKIFQCQLCSKTRKNWKQTMCVYKVYVYTYTCAHVLVSIKSIWGILQIQRNIYIHFCVEFCAVTLFSFSYFSCITFKIDYCWFYLSEGSRALDIFL